MSATSALAAAPIEPENESTNEGEDAREAAPETAAEVRAEDATAELQKAAEQNSDRILRSEVLPPALRERLAGVAAASGEAKLPIEDVLKAIEESLPEFLRQNRVEAAQPPHPAGEVFFRGNSEELSDEQAEQLAQQQLARSGLLRGQRVRVGD